MYKRVLLKISGEQLSGEHDIGIDPQTAHYIAAEIKTVTATGCQVVVIVGGGNVVRGAELAGNGIRRVTADQMGMLSGLMNAMALTDILESRGIKARCISNIYAEQVAENYSYRLAEKHLEKGRVLVVAGGIGRPYFSHDTAAVSIGLELDCEIIMKATKVDGVYDKDPNVHDGAQHLPTVSFQQAVENSDIKVMDKAALGLAMEHKQQIVVFDLMTAGNLSKVVNGDKVGTLIS